mgnify:CR=1 FL=1
MIIFATGGNTDKFYSEGNKSSLQMPEYLKTMGPSVKRQRGKTGQTCRGKWNIIVHT